MRYARSAPFKRLFRKLPDDRQRGVERALLALDEALETGRLSGGLGLKELRFGLWEVRAGLLDRVVFSRSKDLIELLIVGTHDEIRRFLKRH